MPNTGPVGFLSIDLGPAGRPESARLDRMTFTPARILPGFTSALRAVAAGRRPVDEVVAGLFVALHEQEAIAARELDGPVPRPALRRARALLAERLADCPTLDQLAGDVGANKFVLLRQFKRELGVTPRRYAVLLRLARAREDLARGIHIADVAARWGFADQAHLTRQFRSAFGLTPGAYARQVRSTYPPSSGPAVGAAD